MALIDPAGLDDDELVTVARDALTELVRRFDDDRPAQELASESLAKLNAADNEAWKES